MDRVSVRLETVTPLYMGGAHQEPELRPPAFRGALRFWWRALWGSHHGDDWRRMATAEARAFGSTERASSVTLRLKPEATGSPDVVDTRRKPGLAYLLWAFARGEAREAFQAQETRFELQLVERPTGRANGDTNPLTQAAAALWLLVHLGTLGTRARRGFGSMRVTDAAAAWPEGLPPLQIRAGTPQELADALKACINVLRESLEWPLGDVKPQPEFNILHPDACQIYVWETSFRDWRDALDGVGNSLKGARSRTPPDNTGVLAAVEGGAAPKTVERAAFGLPLPFYYPHIKTGATVEPVGRDFNRRASPLLFKVAALEGGRTAVVMTFFKSRFLEIPQLEISPRRGRSVRVPAPDYRAVEKYIRDIAAIPVMGGEA